MRARGVHLVQIDFHDEHFVFIDAAFGQDLPGRARDETVAPKLNSVATGGIFVTDAIHRRDIAAVRDRMRPLTNFP